MAIGLQQLEDLADYIIILGAINWGVVVLGSDLIYIVLGSSGLAHIGYSLVAISGLYKLGRMFGVIK